MDGMAGIGKGIVFEPPMVGESCITRRLREVTIRAAGSSATVLIEGESGTGKEVVARNIHRLSSRAGAPLVILNAMEVPDSLLQSEMFGYVKGTFTGASADRRGLIEEAAGGTFFLDEVGELPLSLQASLLRVVEEREVRRMGESTRRKVDVRFVFATNRNLDSMVREGLFRTDLFYRISCVRITVPPLRERKEDIESLCDYFLERFSSDYGLDKPVLSPRTIDYLKDHDWPGNVRELRNEIERIISLYGNVGEITPGMFLFRGGTAVRGGSRDYWVSGDGLRLSGNEGVHADGAGSGTGGEYTIAGYPMQTGGRSGAESFTLKEAVERLERSAIISALRLNGGNKSKTASSLGITRQGLLKKMRRYGIGQKKRFL